MEASKKRGRPPKYSSKEEKAAANARQKRLKRRSERDLDHAFRAVQFPEVPPGLPPAIDSFVADYNVNTLHGSNSQQATYPHSQQNVPDLPNQDEGDDLSLFLPPDSPPMDPVHNSEQHICNTPKFTLRHIAAYQLAICEGRGQTHRHIGIVPRHLAC